MEAALQRRVQRYGWDKAAEHYEGLWHRQLRPAQDLLLQMADLKRGERVLDIACGTGLVSFRAGDKVEEYGHVLGTDISDKMIAIATSLAMEKKISNIRFARMDAEFLDLPDNSFDVALCALGLMYLPDPLKALQEMYRLLRPSGRAVAAVWGQKDHCGWASLFGIVDKRVSSEVCPLFFQLGNPGISKASFHAAGFVHINTRIIGCVLHYDSPEEACGAAFTAGPVALAYHKFSDQVKEEVNAEYLASVAQYQTTDGFDIPGEFVVTAGSKGGK
ncbi:MAG TPA: methyltransferase domain-containing protein [Puia sp.]|nr:methyltransferase domain-containing protein [Puia sp.]